MSENSVSGLTSEQQNSLEQMSLLAKGLGIDIPDTITPAFAGDVSRAVDQALTTMPDPGFSFLSLVGGGDDSGYKRDKLIEQMIVRSQPDGVAVPRIGSSEWDALYQPLRKAFDNKYDNTKVLFDVPATSAVVASGDVSSQPSGDSSSSNSVESQSSVQDNKVSGFSPDDSTKSSMAYLNDNVFKGLLIHSDINDVASFQNAYGATIDVIKSVSDPGSVSDDPSKHADEFKVLLDGIAANPAFGRLKDAAENSPKSAASMLQMAFGDVPESLKNNPKIIVDLVENRDALVQNLRQLSDGGVFDAKVSPVQVAEKNSPNADEGSVSDVGTKTELVSGDLKPDVTLGAGQGAGSPSGADASSVKPPSEKEVVFAIREIERNMLAPLGDKINKIGGEAAKYADKFANFKPLTEAEIKDEVFAEDQFRVAMIALKYFDGQKNPNGAYDPSMKDGLIKSILEKPEFEPVRQGLNESIKEMNGGALPADADKLKEAQKLRAEYLFSQMDVLYRAELTNTEKAKNDTVYNRFLTQAAEWLPESMKGFLQDFFTGSFPPGSPFEMLNPFGKMLGNYLGSAGIQVGLLWGEESKTAEDLLKDTAPEIQKNFEEIYEKADGANALEKLESMEEGALDSVNSFAARFTQKLLFRGANEDFVENAIKASFDKAEEVARTSGATDADISKAFADEMLVHAQAFRDNPQNTREYGSYSSIEQAALEAQTKEIVDAGVKEYQHVIAIEGQEQQVGFNVEFDKERQFDKVEDRYAGGVPAAIYGVILDNEDKLEISQDLSVIKDEKYFTPEGNAIIEELLIRATIHDHVENGGEVDQAFLDELSAPSEKYPDNPQYMPMRELSMDNYKLVVDYLADQGVDQADIDVFKASVEEIGNNYYGTEPGDLSAGPKQTDSVLEHTVYGGQLKVEAFIPKPEPVVETKPEPVEAPKPEVKDDPVPKKEVAQPEEPKAEPPKDDGCEKDSCKKVFEQVAKPDPEVQFAKLGRVDDPHVYKDLPLFDLNSREAAFLASKDGLNLKENEPKIWDKAVDLGRHPLQVLFDEKMDRTNNGYLYMDLKEMGLSHPNFDGVMAYKQPGRAVELRYVDYDAHEIRSAARHGANPVRDIKEQYEDLGSNVKRLDDFFDEIYRSPGGKSMGSPSQSGGFTQIGMFDSNLRVKSAFDVIYGDQPRSAEKAYMGNYAERWDQRNSAENVERQNHYADASGASANQSRRYEDTRSERENEFNNKSGCERKEPGFENWGGPQKGLNAWGTWRSLRQQGRALGEIFGKNDGDCDNHQASLDVQHGIRDIGADQFDPAANDENYIPGMQSSSPMSSIGRTA